MTSLELRIPPVALALAVAGCMWAIAILFPSTDVEVPWRVALSVGLAGAGAAAALAGVSAFRKASTTVNPTTPGATSAIVASGIYRWSRNPMYLGFLLMLAGWGLFLGSLAAILFVPVFVLYMNRFQIAPEEKALSAKFGTQYGQYLQQVRRWL